ncbi:MAG: DUF3078 domain-containing protein [Bacteroidia bacterium]|jgi:Protein of unknown function (DUF3078)|nr:DUF3078 domain-containing protein [Bacteroidia bacterium]
MKKIVTLLALAAFNYSTAQESATVTPKDTSWKTTGFFGLNASQTAMSNWQGGGQDNVALNAIFNAEAVYKKGKTTWSNKLDAQYGLIKPGEAKLFRKNIDQLFALSKLNVDAFAKHWFYAAQTDFRSQLAPGYNYVGDTISGNATSDFCSPAYIQLALGLDFKPNKYFSAFVAPAAGKITYVSRQYLADAGAYGVEPAVFDAAGNMTSKGERVRFEFGGRLILKFKKDIAKNINIDSYLDLFSNYSNNPGNIDVVFNNLITFKINKYFTANIISQMLYDDEIIVKRDWDKDGKYDKPEDINGPRLQVMSTFAIGFGMKF